MASHDFNVWMEFEVWFVKTDC